MKFQWESRQTWRVVKDDGEVIGGLKEVRVLQPASARTVNGEGWVFVDNGVLIVEDGVGIITAEAI